MPPTPPAAGPSNWLTGSDIQDWRREMTSEQEPETTGPAEPSVEGRIRILDKEFFTLGYLSTAVHSDGPGHIVSRDISKALRLRVAKIAHSDCHQLIIMVREHADSNHVGSQLPLIEPRTQGQTSFCEIQGCESRSRSRLGQVRFL